LRASASGDPGGVPAAREIQAAGRRLGRSRRGRPARARARPTEGGGGQRRAGEADGGRGGLISGRGRAEGDRPGGRRRRRLGGLLAVASRARSRRAPIGHSAYTGTLTASPSPSPSIVPATAHKGATGRQIGATGTPRRYGGRHTRRSRGVAVARAGKTPRRYGDDIASV